MRRSLPPRWRAPIVLSAAAIAALILGGSSHGWASAAYLSPVVVAVIVGYSMWAGRDSDSAAVIRRQADERQAVIRLKVQAFVGRALSVAVALAYLIALTTHTTLWPFAVLLAVLAVSFLTAWLIYRERSTHDRADDDHARPHRFAPLR